MGIWFGKSLFDGRLHSGETGFGKPYEIGAVVV
jgi:hypothetical protein